MPAWVERAGETLPLAPGMILESGDRLRTGANAKLLLKLAEGSSVRLGENARLALERIGSGKERVFDAALHVFDGAFRFTTDALQRTRKRNINITVATLTAGIRGTDVWGKSTPERDLVCLIEGRIEVQHPRAAPITMDQAMSFYVAPRGAAPLPVAPVDAKQLAIWSAETAIDAGKGATRRGGKWKVLAASVASQAEALQLYDALRTAGYAARILPAREGEALRYEVAIGQLPSQAEAAALATQLRGRLGVTEPKVSR